MKKKVFILLFDGFSDWEIAYLTPELQKSEKLELHYFSFDNQPVTSMGGLSILPSIPINEVDEREMDMLILPGGTFWETEENQKIKSLVKSHLTAGKKIAAICAATTFLGKQGALDQVKHTSNDLGYLKKVAPQYNGEQNYQYTLAVADKNITTANGIAPIEFAKEVFIQLEIFDLNYIEKWFQLFKNGVWTEEEMDLDGR